MPRNSSGTMTAPPGQPAVSGTTISSATFNTLVGDLIAETTDSASRSGKGGFTAPVRGADGTVAAPAYSFTSEVGDGMYRAGTGDVRFAVTGVDALSLASGGVKGPLNLIAGTTSVQVTFAGGFLLLQGNRIAADTNLADVVADSSVARTAGNLFGVRNNGTGKLYIDYQGLLQLATPATSIQPATIWTAITPDTNVAAGGNLGYWKDANGIVHFRGSVTNNTGGATTNLVTTAPLPAGFRPSGTARTFSCQTNSGTALPVGIGTGGAITILFALSLANGTSLYLDVISFTAEQ